MRTKQFKTESKKLMDMMINSIYTHKEIFLRELISNASDAIDKLYFRSLTDDSVELSRGDFAIRIDIDKASRSLTISDNGCGMTEEELESNLGTIAKSGSHAFKAEHAEDDTTEIDVIGQFGVGFYSAFMISDDVTVESRAFGSEQAYCWHSKGAEGYTISPCDKSDFGTKITLKVKEKTENEDYDEFLDEYRLSAIVKKYSDYIRYPIKMNMESRRLKEGSDNEYESFVEERTLNSMLPIWKKTKAELGEDEYNNFYQEKFYDYEKPLKVIHSTNEGAATFTSLLYIPSHAPFDYYTKAYEKGLRLYSKGVLISESCSELLPDYYSFVKGLIDSEDLSLNISREMLQHDHQLKLIAKTIEKQIKRELKKMMTQERENYEKFFKSFGMGLKHGVYNDYGLKKEELRDLLLFESSFEGKKTSLDEYVSRMPENQKSIYYACGESIEKIELLPQTEAVKDKGFEILYLTDYIDEFAIKVLAQHNEKPFCNICADDTGLDSDEEKESLKQENEEARPLLDTMKEALGDAVSAVRFTGKLKTHPVCLTSEGAVSLEMEKVLGAMPNSEGIKASLILDINAEHEIAARLKELFAGGEPEAVKDYAKLLYAQARLIEGLTLENPTEFSQLVCRLMLK